MVTARDKERDAISCGAGRDVVVADLIDIVLSRSSAAAEARLRTYARYCWCTDSSVYCRGLCSALF